MSAFVLEPGGVVAARYRVTRPLGHGAYGAVYEAERVAGGPSVALKVMHGRLGRSKDASARFEREADLLSRLRHPALVQVLDYGTTSERLPFIAFELLRGHNLEQEVEYRGRLDLATAYAVMRQVLTGLAAVHDAGIVHRDIKPANIFLCVPERKGGQPLAKLLDFGTARMLSGEQGPRLTASGQMLGTPHYMAPEQVRGETVDARADIYSLGTVLAEMVTGERLLPGDTEIEVYMAHVADEPMELPASLLQSPVASVVARAVSKQPAERYQTAPAMLAALEQAVASTLLVAVGSARRSSRVMAWTLVVVLVLLALALAAGAYLLLTP